MWTFQLPFCNWLLVEFHVCLRTCFVWFLSFFNLKYYIWPRLWPVLVNVLCELEKTGYSAVIGCSIRQISIRLSWLMVTSWSTISLLIFSLFDVSVTERKILTSTTTIVGWRILPWSFFVWLVCFYLIHIIWSSFVMHLYVWYYNVLWENNVPVHPW